jgi:hypothetical protein
MLFDALDLAATFVFAVTIAAGLVGFLAAAQIAR